MTSSAWLYLIADQPLSDIPNKLESTLQASNGIVSSVQLRDLKRNNFVDLKLLKRIADIIHAYNARCIVSRNLELASLTFIDGIHTGKAGPSVKECKTLFADKKIIGLSIHSIDEAFLEHNLTADYLLLSPIYSPLSKSDTRSPLGLTVLRKLRSFTTQQIIALGGIKPANAFDCLQAGADAVASLSLLQAAKPEDIIRQYLTLALTDKTSLDPSP